MRVAALTAVAAICLAVGTAGGVTAGASTAPPVTVIRHVKLKPLQRYQGKASGKAEIVKRVRQRQLVVYAQLPVTKRREAYEVWLYNSRTDARSLGKQVTDRTGGFEGSAPLPRDYLHWRYIDISIEPVGGRRTHSGRSVVRGRLQKARAGR